MPRLRPAPGHSTILTGDHPARTGIVANDWYQPASARGRTAIYCAEDETRGNYDDYVVSPMHLKVPVLGERLKAIDPRSQSVAIAGKDRAAVMMGGRAPDVRWYFRDGRFQTDVPGQKPTLAQQMAQARADSETAIGATPFPVPESCRTRDRPVKLPGGRVVGNGRLGHGPGKSEYPFGPALDRNTLTLASDLVDERRLAATMCRTCWRSACRQRTMSVIATGPKDWRCACRCTPWTRHLGGSSRR